MPANTIIQVFEWETIYVGNELTKVQFQALTNWQYSQTNTYFKPGLNSITFSQWVGVLQVGNLIIEVLPKADEARYSGDCREEAVHRWKSVLMGMLRKVGKLNLRHSEDTDLAVAKQNLFDIYFQGYLDEVETLIHRGLVKKYRKEDKNRNALKGKLKLSTHIRKNVVHKEKFYTEALVYDRQNPWNQILLDALRVTANKTTNGRIKSKALNIQLNFPDWQSKKYSKADFDKLVYDRKTEGYRKAIQFAKLILLSLNPQIASGKENVIAILFDMNKLWEEWLLASFKSSSLAQKREIKVHGKRQLDFLVVNKSFKKKIESDILIEDLSNNKMLVLDAKWKRPYQGKPADDDIKQMFVYNLMWDSMEAWLVYPKVSNEKNIAGDYQYDEAGQMGMAYISIIEDGKLNTDLTLPKID
jgi:5-methylcytosine-specific restriction enzyme subunit McrC